MKIRTCAECGEPFEAPNPKQIYCTKACAIQHANNKRKEYLNNSYQSRKMAKIMSQFTKSKAFEIEAKERKNGSNYAEYQKRKTLQMIAEGKL